MQEDMDLIHHYLTGTLSPAEEALFRQRLASDKALRQQVALHGLSLEALRQHKAEALRTRFSNAENTLVREKAMRQPPHRGLTVAGGLLAIIFVFLWVLWKNIDRPTSPRSIPSLLQTTVDSTLQPPDTLLRILTPTPIHKDSSAAKQIAVLKQLYAEHFKVYHPESTNEGGVRGRDTTSQKASPFFRLYNNRQYREALRTFPANVPDSLQLYQANALLETGNAKKAISVLLSIIEHGESQYVLQSRWYLALAYLKTGRPQLALKYLQILKDQSEGGYKKQAATKLIEKLKKSGF